MKKRLSLTEIHELDVRTISTGDLTSMFARRGILLAFWFAISISLTQAQTSARKPQVPNLKVEKYSLPNGLEVILHEDKTTTVVDVDVWYKVGSKN